MKSVGGGSSISDPIVYDLRASDDVPDGKESRDAAGDCRAGAGALEPDTTVSNGRALARRSPQDDGVVDSRTGGSAGCAPPTG